MSSKLLNLGVSLSVVAGASACSVERTSSPPDTTENYSVSNGNADWAEHTFKNVSNFWRQRGVGMKALNLVILSGNDTFQCDKKSKVATSDAESSFYCSPNHTIVIPAAEFAAKWVVKGKQMGRQVVQFTLEHEVGHYVDDETGGIQADRGKKTAIGAELLATCYAGEYAGSEQSPTSIKNVTNFLRYLPNKNLNQGHGTQAQQAAAYRRGVNSGACQRYDNGM